MLVHPTQAVEIFRNISTVFDILAIRWQHNNSNRFTALSVVETAFEVSLNFIHIFVSKQNYCFSARELNTRG